MTPYLPNKDQDFNAWLNNFSALITANPATYGLVPGDAVIIAAQQTAFSAALTLATDPGTRTAPTVAAKDAARVIAEATVRPYATAISRNPAVDPGDKSDVGVTIPDPSRTPIPAPTSAPVLSTRSATIGSTVVDYRDSVDPTPRAKPFGVIGCQLFAAFGTVPAISPESLSFAGQFTKSPMTISTAGQSGKVISMAARWITRAGPGGAAQIGPFGAIVSQFVP
jgi:hypothetical protein